MLQSLIALEKKDQETSKDGCRSEYQKSRSPPLQDKRKDSNEKSRSLQKKIRLMIDDHFSIRSEKTLAGCSFVKCKNLRVFFIIYHFWTVGWTEEAIWRHHPETLKLWWAFFTFFVVPRGLVKIKIIFVSALFANWLINRQRSWSAVMLLWGRFSAPPLSDRSSFISVYPNGKR